MNKNEWENSRAYKVPHSDVEMLERVSQAVLQAQEQKALPPELVINVFYCRFELGQPMLLFELSNTEEIWPFTSYLEALADLFNFPHLNWCFAPEYHYDLFKSFKVQCRHVASKS